jgi:hypothetical protein
VFPPYGCLPGREIKITDWARPLLFLFVLFTYHIWLGVGISRKSRKSRARSFTSPFQLGASALRYRSPVLLACRYQYISLALSIPVSSHLACLKLRLSPTLHVLRSNALGRRVSTLAERHLRVCRIFKIRDGMSVLLEWRDLTMRGTMSLVDVNPSAVT